MAKFVDAVNPDLAGNGKTGARIVKAACIAESVGELLMIVNYLLFTKDYSFHRLTYVQVELGLLALCAAVAWVCNFFTAKGNGITKVFGAVVIILTCFYNVLDFIMQSSMVWEKGIKFLPGLICITAVLLLKYVSMKLIFTNRHAKVFFYEKATSRTVEK